MPVINPQRQGLNLPSVQAQATNTNFQVGVAAPDMSGAKITARRGAAMQQFLQDFTGGFDQQVKEDGARAAVQGAIDAQNSTDALAQKDEKVSKQNWLMRSFYENGYVSAAASQQLAQYRVDSTERAKNAALSGLTEEEFREQEQKATADFQSKMAQYLPDMDKQSAVQALSSLQQTSAANYKEFMQQRAKQAIINADRSLDTNLSSTLSEFNQRLSTGSYADAEGSLMSGMGAILAANHLDKDKKLERVNQYLVAAAQNTDNPMIIDGIQKLATRELGVNSVAVNKSLFEQFKRAGNQLEGQTLFEVSDKIDAIKTLPPDQQEARIADIRTQLIAAGSSGILSPGTMMSTWSEVQKQREKTQQTYALQDALTSGKTPATYAAAAGIDLDKARNNILDKFPDTALGNIQLLQYGTQAKDPWSIEKAQTRMGKQVAGVITTLDQLGEDGQISAENQATLNTFTQMYSKSTDVGKMALSGQIPEEYRGIVQRAIAQSPNNASNIILDDLRRLAQNKASGRYDNVPVSPSSKMIDPSGESNWFSFGSTADAQRQEARAAMEAEYRYMYRKNPEALVGKDAEDINTMLKGNIQSRKLEVEIAGKPRFVYLPPGSSLQEFMGGYQGSTEQFTKSLQDTISSSVNAVIDPSKLERVVVQAGTSGSAGRGMTATVFSKDGTFQNISINTGQVAELAQERYQEELAGQIKEGEAAQGMRPASFYDHDNNRTVQMNVSGVNSARVQPGLFAEIAASTMEFEGFRQNKGNGSVGFGLHDNSGMPVPAATDIKGAVNMLKGSLEKQYIPNARKAMKDYGIPETAESMKVLVDLNYHGGNGSTTPVAKAMQEYRETVKNPLSTATPMLGSSGAEAGVWLALRAQPAYKEAQPVRKRYLEENLRDWMYSTKVGN